MSTPLGFRRIHTSISVLTVGLVIALTGGPPAALADPDTATTAPAPATTSETARASAETTASAAATTSAEVTTPPVTSTVPAPPEIETTHSEPTAVVGAPTVTPPPTGTPSTTAAATSQAAPPPPALTPTAVVAPAETPNSATSSAPETSGATATTTTATTSPATSPATTSPAPAPVVAIEPEQPQTLEAAPVDVEAARTAPPVEQQPAAAPKQEIAVIAAALREPDRRADREPARREDPDRQWDRTVRQWDRDWVTYDRYYRPVLSNPYRDPVRIVYVYERAPRVVTIPPLTSIVLEVARLAAYSFTAMVLGPYNQVSNVAVGSFLGGGYAPAIGLPAPPPPPPVVRYDNVPVQVRYRDAVYEPFRVQRVVDVGVDPEYGGHKVLLDGVTPAWGTWNQTPTGERLFEVNKTQQYPGLDEPQQVPLPGDYRLRLVAENTTAAADHRTDYLIAAALTCAALSVAALIGSAILGRRRVTDSTMSQ